MSNFVVGYYGSNMSQSEPKTAVAKAKGSSFLIGRPRINLYQTFNLQGM